MKTITWILSSFVVVFALVAVNNVIAADAQDTPNWQAFSQNLQKALSSGNAGLQQSAMRQVIKYGDNLNVGDGALEILRVYRSKSNLGTRRLALRALPQTHSKLIDGFLRRAVEFEKSPVLKRQLQFVVAEQDAK